MTSEEVDDDAQHIGIQLTDYRLVAQPRVQPHRGSEAKLLPHPVKPEGKGVGFFCHVLVDGSLKFQRFCVPHLADAVEASRGKLLPVRRERHMRDSVPVAPHSACVARQHVPL
eukprot:CAMPEP_0180326844 /NCGR_PEP_ID=MMETSP0988-20121125/39221_1 /TAXON_ID=697907 /ORGANISM="non described non described, Strain CCMP2293" /LENGTH=112 /DNA_ID=CAMNT_0022313461 /DNA_START=89 /DNA_END=424 /DNA_ORIENTATION=+